MKLKSIDKKAMIIISVAVLAIIVSYFNVTYAYFGTSKNEEISLKSAASFGEATVYNYNDILEGNLTYTRDKSEMLKGTTTSFKKDNVDEFDYLLTVAAQVKPHETLYELDEYTSISYEIYHKTDLSLNTSSFTCTENVSTNGDYCDTGTFISGSLEGKPFELIKDFRISDTEMHYFDVYIYLNKEGESKAFKTNIFYLDKETEKNNSQNNFYKDPILNGSDPDLSIGLVPVKYNMVVDYICPNDEYEEVCDDEVGECELECLEDEEEKIVYELEIVNPEEKWYDYENQKWANAVILAPGVSNEVGTKLSVDKEILAMFVWIPRFSYTIGCTSNDSCLGYKIEGASNLTLETPGAIDIMFEAKNSPVKNYNGDSPTYIYSVDSDEMPTSDRVPSNWYTHPAFWSDNNGDGIRENSEELSGIWVGKFETSVNKESECYENLISGHLWDCCISENEDVTPRILPDVLSLTGQNMFEQYETAKKFKTESLYRLSSNADSYMMKNSEWGAVAYLSQSIYGKYGNDDYEGIDKEIYFNNSGTADSVARYTGRSAGASENSDSFYKENGTYEYSYDFYGTGASTTGNISGIYDMSGGAGESVMGYYMGASTEFGGFYDNNYLNYSGFTNQTKPHIKYFNGYNSKDILTKSTEVIGHATAETYGWYSDVNDNLSDSLPWIARGGNYETSGDNVGIFYSDQNKGPGGSEISFRTVLISTN